MFLFNWLKQEELVFRCRDNYLQLLNTWWRETIINCFWIRNFVLYSLYKEKRRSIYFHLQLIISFQEYLHFSGTSDVTVVSAIRTTTQLAHFTTQLELQVFQFTEVITENSCQMRQPQKRKFTVISFTLWP